MVPRLFSGRTVVCIGTGPSLTMAQVETARRKGFVLTGCNNVALDVPDLAVLYGCNYEWWVAYWEIVKDHPAQKWSSNKEASERFGVNWIAEKDASGLSSDPRVIHHGHGSGYSLLNLVYLMGADRIVLLGYDQKYDPAYHGRDRIIGPTPRHYFGEYPPQLQHWPSVHVKHGVHVDLVRRYGEIAIAGPVEIINCTPGSAIECFPMMEIADVPG
jgi:hypothetical protein